MPELAELIERVEKALKQAEGSGHHIHFGGASVRRYDSETGKPYYRDDPAYLSTSPAKMQAIWEMWEMRHDLLALLKAMEASRG